MSNPQEIFGLLTPAWIRQPGRRPGAAGRQAAAVFAGRDLLRTKRVGPGGENEELVFPFRKLCMKSKGVMPGRTLADNISSLGSTHMNSSESMHRGGRFFVAPGGENRWPLTTSRFLPPCRRPQFRGPCRLPRPCRESPRSLPKPLPHSRRCRPARSASSPQPRPSCLPPSRQSPPCRLPTRPRCPRP